MRRIQKTTLMVCDPCVRHGGEHGEDEKEGSEAFLGAVAVVYYCYGFVCLFNVDVYSNCRTILR